MRKLHLPVVYGCTFSRIFQVTVWSVLFSLLKLYIYIYIYVYIYIYIYILTNIYGEKHTFYVAQWNYVLNVIRSYHKAVSILLLVYLRSISALLQDIFGCFGNLS